MFHKVIINNTDTTDSQYDREVLIKFDGNVIINKLDQMARDAGKVYREFCSVFINKERYQILGSLDELMDKFNNNGAVMDACKKIADGHKKALGTACKTMANQRKD